MTKKITYKKRLKLPIGSYDYRAFVGPLDNADIYSALQFSLLTSLGLREYHCLLDIGCGSLRAGKLFIPYLLANKYYGLDPEKWLIDEGIKNETGQDIIKIKKPHFSYSKHFRLSTFNKKFDYLLAQSVFSHAAFSQIVKCLSEAKKVMKPSSIFVANYFKGNKNYQGNKWVYPECVSYTDKFMSSMVNRLGLDYKEIDWPHPNQLTWFLIKHPQNKMEFNDISSSAKVLRLQNHLIYTQERLDSMLAHPYVKLGLSLNNIYQYIRRFLTNLRIN